MLSVIFPTRNRAELLAAALQSLEAQSLPRRFFEVLVIDNGSTDATAALAQRRMMRLGNLKYYSELEPGLHAGRHRGMLEAKGDVLVFADDDIEALPTWLASIHEAFSDPTVTMVGGNCLPKFLATPTRWLSRLWEPGRVSGVQSLAALSIQQHPQGVREVDPLQVWGCNFAIRKEALLGAGGFHPDAMPRELIRFRGDGETHVSRYVASRGLKCLFHSGASVFHVVTPERMTLAYLRQRGFDQGISDSYTLLRGEDTASSRQRSLARRVARRGLNIIKELANRVRLGVDARRALESLRAGHREGYSFHQTVYRTDPDVRDWVHRARYF